MTEPVQIVAMTAVPGATLVVEALLISKRSPGVGTGTYDIATHILRTRTGLLNPPPTVARDSGRSRRVFVEAFCEARRILAELEALGAVVRVGARRGRAPKWRLAPQGLN